MQREKRQRNDYASLHRRQTLPQQKPLVAPLELLNPRRADLTGLPLQFGMPFPQGAITSVKSCELRAGGERLAANATPLSRWNDGSLRWALIETRTPADLKYADSVTATIHINENVRTVDADAPDFTAQG